MSKYKVGEIIKTREHSDSFYYIGSVIKSTNEHYTVTWNIGSARFIERFESFIHEIEYVDNDILFTSYTTSMVEE